MRFDASPRNVRRAALVLGIGAIVFSGVAAYRAISYEVAGRAIYRSGLGRTSSREPVTRGESPSKFREATNIMWATSGFPLVVGAVGFAFYRKIDDCSDDYF